MDERGATVAEYAGSVVVAALLVGGLWAGLGKPLASLPGKLCAVAGSCAKERPRPPIVCVRAPCGPRPSVTPPEPRPDPRPTTLPTKLRPTPPIECFRAPCPGSGPVVPGDP